MKCSFCGNEIEKGTGKMLAKNDGKIFYFCSSRCEKNLFKLSRTARNIKWTQEAIKIKKGAKR
jgi:large subunit ribosomal protein L24e